MSAMLNRYKAEGESRIQQDKNQQERRRNLLILIANYLLDCGYIESSNVLQKETQLSLDKWEVADNISLYYVLQDYEEYQEIRLNKKPKLVKKLNDKLTLPKIKAKPGLARKPSAPAKSKSSDQEESASNGGLLLEGKKMQMQKEEAKEESPDQFFENRVIKPLPDYSYNPDLKALAESLQRQIINANPNVRFQDVVGLGRAKQLLKEAVLMPMKYPHLFTGLLEPWKGILLFGPPGTGKTMLAKAVATECKTTFFNISASSIVSKWRGDSEKLVRLLFELARYHEPSTIFLDEIDSIMSERTSEGEHEASRRMKTQLLLQLDGLVKGKERVFLLAASNLPWDLDSALLRRLQKRIMVPLPGQEARTVMLQKLLPAQKASELNYQESARKMEVRVIKLQNYSGSDIRLVCKQAAMRPLRRLMAELESADTSAVDNWSLVVDPAEVPPIPMVTSDDLEEALKVTKKSSVLPPSKYEGWEREFGSI